MIVPHTWVVHLLDIQTRIRRVCLHVTTLQVMSQDIKSTNVENQLEDVSTAQTLAIKPFVQSMNQSILIKFINLISFKNINGKFVIFLLPTGAHIPFQ